MAECATIHSRFAIEISPRERAASDLDLRASGLAPPREFRSLGVLIFFNTRPDHGGAEPEGREFEVSASGDRVPGGSESSTRTPRVTLFAEANEGSDLLQGFPGRFAITPCSSRAELESLLLASPADLVVLDCRERFPEGETLRLVQADPHLDYLAVGQPASRRSLPKSLSAHWCPWPVDRRSFYRLVVALVRKAHWQRAFRREEHRAEQLRDEARLGGRVAQVLHELNNPLDAVRRFVALARDECAKESDSAAHLDHALLGLNRMKETLDGLHGEARRRGLRLDLVELRELVREAALLSGLAGSKMEVRTRLGDRVTRLPRALGPVLVNLLLNAQEACRGEGLVHIEAKRDDEELRLEIRDDGEGFGELFRDELFQPYFSTRSRDEGLGLGLPTARAAVEQLGGSLEGHSPGVNRGATFLIRLPLFDDPEEK
jgi:signal transduction histidine kinase